MRNTILAKITELARKDKDIVLLTADLGFSLFEKFRDEFPDRFYNMGVAEQNMVGVAAGLALCGKKVYIYSIAPFIVSRCFEQIKLDVCVQKLNVKMLGAGGGFSYSLDGVTHHSFEDIGILRTLPNIKIICPGDSFEAEAAALDSYEYDGPCYIRITKKKQEQIHKKIPEIKKPTLLRKGNDAVIFTMGNMLKISLDVSKRIKKEKNLDVAIYSVPVLKPFNKEAFSKIAAGFSYVFSIEEHTGEGGLGSIIAECLAEIKQCVTFKKFFIREPLCREIGSWEHLCKISKLSGNDIFNGIMSAMKK